MAFPSDPRYHPLDVRAETLSAEEAAEVEAAYDRKRGRGRRPLRERPEGPFAANLSAALALVDAQDIAEAVGDTPKRIHRLSYGYSLPHYYADIVPIAQFLKVDPAHLAFEPTPAFRARLLARRAA